jgi:hypothetical protein
VVVVVEEAEAVPVVVEVAEAVPAMGPVVAAGVVPATVLAGAVAKVGAVAVDGATTTVVDMVGAAAMAAAGATMPGAAGGISAIRLTLIDRRMAVNLRGSFGIVRAGHAQRPGLITREPRSPKRQACLLRRQGFSFCRLRPRPGAPLTWAVSWPMRSAGAG